MASYGFMGGGGGGGGGLQMLAFEGTVEEFHRVFGSQDEFSYGQLEGRHDYM